MRNHFGEIFGHYSTREVFGTYPAERVSSTSAMGWRVGGGVAGTAMPITSTSQGVGSCHSFHAIIKAPHNYIEL